MNSYEAKQAARKTRYEELAARNQAKAAQEFHKGDLREEVSGIPFGQPILVGHHSERRHRNAIERANNATRRGIEAQSKAGYYAAKADSVGKSGISSDDPEAVTKLREKLAKLETRQEHMKAANKLVRKGDADGLAELVGSEKLAAFIMEPDFCGRRGYASYELTNNNANIRRLKQRLETLEAAQTAEHKETEQDGVRIVENVEENRIQLFFPDKPSIDIRSTLKSSGFRWSRYNGCWQRHLNNAGRYAAECVLKKIRQ